MPSMPTVSIDLFEALKQRVLAVSRRKGISPHAFMVGAIEKASAAAGQQAAFVAEAIAAQDEMLASGQGFDVDEVHAYIAARIAGKKPARPVSRTWRKRLG
jgi:predicted transcriptional regulator